MSTYRETAHAPTLVVALSGNVFGLDPDTGTVLWEHELDQAGNPTALILTETFIYAATFRTLSCLRYPTGKLVWSVDTQETGRATLLLQGDRLLVAKAGVIECFSLSGKVLWLNGFKGKGQGEIALGYPGNVAQADQRG